MTGRLPGPKTTAIGMLATAAIVGGTSPVWAGTTHSAADQPSQSGTITVSVAAARANAEKTAALEAEIAKLKTALDAEHGALHQAKLAQSSETQIARAAEHAAARWKAADADATTHPKVVVKQVAVKPADDPTTPTNPCRHHAVDPAAWPTRGDQFRHCQHGGHDGFRH